MAFFDDFTSALKQKWLQYYQLNHSWLALQMEVENVKTPDGGRRPSSYLILGVLNALEPKLAQLMLPFSKLNSDPDSLIEVLELNFDPDVVLGKRPPTKAAPTAPSAAKPAAIEEPVESELDDLSDFSAPEESGSNAAVLGIAAVGGAAAGAGIFAAATALQDEESGLEEMDLDDLDDESSLAVEESSADGLDDIGISDFGDDESLTELSDDESDEGFADISLDAFGDTTDTEELSDTSDSDFSGNVWGSETEELSEESLADFGDLSLDDFGSNTEKNSDDEEEDAFASLDFDPFADPNQNSLDDEWK
ncbi:DUF5331 domain-containing protein [Phormidium sp. LEGE 05292]|uniref:DUF5331 domain-containing protein n=1 Tax=[Phormidium] sp. LEGE 05292 TaxID=767427 RepID=UPI00187FE088|nr:DUF5331 domain-containing protein [Phormidium sp. LEGE 05292]MBE9228932.1 DUF5331 domain-containing protein [Phormidium sp. LEGE 05292]